MKGKDVVGKVAAATGRTGALRRLSSDLHQACERQTEKKFN